MCACGGRQSPPPQADPHGVRPGIGTPGTVSAPSADECAALIAHAVALGAQGEPAPAEEDLARIRDELTTELGPSCRAMSRSAYRCALASASLGELETCAQPRTSAAPQASASNSTSNSSVAPGGITPAAPRSP
jgi:hypothetical protein